MTAFLPKVGEAMVENTGQPRPSYRRWMQQVTEAVNTPATPPGPDPEPPTSPISFVINGSGSVTADGSIAGGEFVIGLDNDKDEPGNTKYYGTDSSGNRGFVALSEGLEAGSGIALTDSGYTMLPSVATPADLPLTGNAGEAVRVTDEAPGVYAWDGAAFTLDTAADGKAGIVLDATADLIEYDNTTSGLAATDVQAAVDELSDEKLDDAASDGNFYGRKNGAWTAMATGGGWTQIAAWDGATDPATNAVVGDVSGYSQSLVICNGVAMSASGFRFVTVSVNGGSSYLSTNAYNGIDGNGVVTVENALLVHSTASASARSGHVHLFCLNETMAAKPTSNPARSLPAGLIVGSASPITHVRCNSSTGNFNAGQIFIYAK